MAKGSANNPLFNIINPKMIIDTLENFENYIQLNPLFEKVAQFLKENDLNQLEVGKHLIAGEDLFVNIQLAKGKTEEEAVQETHKVMADIQIPLSGCETYGYIPACMLPEGEYNEDKDITKFPGVSSQSYVTCTQGMFAIFFPQDGHAPCITDKPELKKAIFKVKC